MRRMAHLSGSARLWTSTWIEPKMTAPKPAAIHGAMPQEAAICDTLDFFQPQFTEMSDAIPTPTRAPTIDCVVLTGKPRRVQTVNHVAEPGVYQWLTTDIDRLQGGTHQLQQRRLLG